jgi:hypothetical protein
MLDHPSLHPRTELTSLLPLQDDKRDTGLPQQMGDNKTGRTGPDDANHRIPNLH